MNEVASLVTARAKLAALIEVFAPMHAGRDNALASMNGILTEFETAIREDERALSVGKNGELPLDSGVPGVAVVDTSVADETLPAPADEAQAPVAIPPGTTDVQGTPLPETLPPAVADSVASGEPLREVSEVPPEAPTKKGKNK